MRGFQPYQFHQVLPSQTYKNYQIRFSTLKWWPVHVNLMQKSRKIVQSTPFDEGWMIVYKLEIFIEPFRQNKFIRSHLKWQSIGNQLNLTSARTAPKTLGRAHIRISVILGNFKVVRDTGYHLQKFVWHQASLSYSWSLKWGLKFLISRPKTWPNASARGKNFGDVFFDVFRQPEQESEIRLPKHWLVAEIHDLSTLFVRDCSF